MPEPSFETLAGQRVHAVTADEMRDVDRVAVEEVGLQLLQMMENAGRGLARTVHYWSAGRTLVFAGNGGNGGGAMACARHLSNHGVPVEVVLDRDPGELSGAAQAQYRILDSMAVPVRAGEPERVDEASVLVDGLVGYGLDGALRGTAGALVDAMNDAGAPVVSLDVPSGVNATTGARPGPAIDPDEVVTLALPKTGLTAYASRIKLLDIGIPAVVYDTLDIPYDGPFGYSDVVTLRATAAE
jgi:NAD(P)H-hydrate epimerase